MDAGIGTAASFLTLVGTAIAIADRLHTIFKKVRNAPDEIIALLNEAQAIRIVLSDVRERESTLAPWLDLSALTILLHRAHRQLERCNQFVERFVSLNAQEELVFNRLAWYLKKEESQRHLTELANVRNNAIAVLSCANLSANVHIALSVKNIAVALSESRIAEQDLFAAISQFEANTNASFAAIEERFRRFSIEPQPTDNARLLHQYAQLQTEGAHDTRLLDQHKKSIEPGGPSVTYPRYRQCSVMCTCRCHVKIGIKTPTFAYRLMGRLMISYTGGSALGNLCSSPMCSRHRGTMFNIHYLFPKWLLFRILHVVGSTVGDPKFSFSFPRVISQDSPIFEMARLGDILGMKTEFAERRMSPLVVTEHGETLIQETIHNGFPRAARFLIEMGANPEVENDVAVTPGQEAWDYVLRRAFDESTLEEYRTLFSLTESDLEDRGFSVIHEYVLGLRSADSFAKSIQQHIWCIDAVDRTGRTAAHWAVLRSDVEKLRILMECGADPNIKDSTWGNALLDYSVRCPSAECTKILLDFGADVNSRTTCKWTPLYGCGTYRKSSIAKAHVENAKLLLAHGADIDARDEDGVDALMKATRQEIPLLAAYLLDEGNAKIDTCDRDGVSALAYAIRRQSFQTLEVLLDRGADYRVTDKKQNSILHVAAAEADLSTLKILQQYSLHGLDPDAKNAEALTPREVVLKREDTPEDFLPCFIRLCADIRTRNRGQKVEPASKSEKMKSTEPGLKTANVRLVEVEDSSEDEEFEDAVEYNIPFRPVVWA